MTPPAAAFDRSAAASAFLRGGAASSMKAGLAKTGNGICMVPLGVDRVRDALQQRPVISQGGDVARVHVLVRRFDDRLRPARRLNDLAIVALRGGPPGAASRIIGAIAALLASARSPGWLKRTAEAMLLRSISERQPSTAQKNDHDEQPAHRQHDSIGAGDRRLRQVGALDGDPTIVPSPIDARWYRAMIAKVILFKAIESMIKTKEAKEVFRQGWVNIATYVVSVVADRLGDKLDLEQIWMRQGISAGLRDLLWDWAVVVNAEFNRIAPGQQISEVAKRADTWAKVRSAEFPVPRGSIQELR